MRAYDSRRRPLRHRSKDPASRGARAILVACTTMLYQPLNAIMSAHAIRRWKELVDADQLAWIGSKSRRTSSAFTSID
jgi:hypothetical protein